MKKNIHIFLAVVILTLIGASLRFYNLANNPSSLNIDEVSYGYSAYSILKTGKDENGIFMPLTFKSIGDYKNPVLIYSLIPSIAIFGLNEFGVRFTTAFFGALSILALFLLTSSLTKSRKIAFVAAALLTISPWHIYYSRFASESLIGLFFLILGMWFFQKIEEGLIWAVLSSATLALSLYSYHSLRFFIPFFILCLILLKTKGENWQKLSWLVHGKKNLLCFVALSMALVLPLLYLIILGPVNTRAVMVFLSQDIDYTRYVILDHVNKFGENFLLFFFWIKRYLNYFQPDFLFFDGLNMTKSGTLGLGVLYLFELPWLILGVVEIAKNRCKNSMLVVLWILIGIFPASITNNEQSAVRTLLILPALLLIVSIGALSFFQMINRIKKRVLRLIIIVGYVFFILTILVQSFLVFAVHFPLQRGESFMEGTKETVLYALSNKGKYNEIVFDPYRGVEAPYIVSIPHMYILFYSQYDPYLFQTKPKSFSSGSFSFDKFTIRRIDWRVDRKKTGILFIGSPWSLPEKDINSEEILHRVYLSGGQLAFLIVTPKPK